MSQISRIDRLHRQLVAPEGVASALDGFRMDNKVCIVTGASSGLGARFAKVLHEVGAKVVVCARRADRMAELQAECNGELTAVQCDVVKAEDRERLVATTLQAHGRIDCLINNAGISIDDGQPATKIAPETFLQVMDVNVNALFFLSQKVAEVMLKQKEPHPARRGVIVNIASVHALGASASVNGASGNNNLSYATSKAAVVNMTRELAIQWAKRGVRVNAMCPGYFPSEIHQSKAMPAEMTIAADHGVQNVLDPAGKLNPYSEHILNHIAMGRLGDEAELDGALLFMCSDASTYMTGTTVSVDGGWTHR